MKAITKYVSNDGSEWDNKEQATDRDILCLLCDLSMSCLPCRPEESNKRVRVDIDLVTRKWEECIKICREEWPNDPVFKRNPKAIGPFSIAGRIVDDSGCKPIQNMFGWFACYRDGWLYNQPYFAMNPGEFKGE